MLKIKKVLCAIIIVLLFTVPKVYADSTTTLNLIKQNEGLVLKPYKGPKGSLLIGYGHNLGVNGIPKEIAGYLLLLDVRVAEIHLRSIFINFKTFSKNRKTALTDMMYCMGKKNFLTFKKTIKAIKQNNWRKAANEIEKSLWYRKFTTRSTKDIKLLCPDYFENSYR